MKTSSLFTALALKLIGIILIVSSLIDYIVLLIPFNPLNQQWQLAFTTQIVDRGIIPMVGLALLFLGYWVSNTTDDAPTERKPWLDLRFWAFLLASLLGLLFLLLVPIHLNNIRLASDLAVQQINQRANLAENQITNQSQQVNTLLSDNSKLQELDKALNNPQVPPEQKAQLQAIKQQIEKFKQDPKALNQKVEEAQTQLRSGKLEAEKRAKTEAWKQGLRTGVSSLLLSLGYIVIGWTGLRSMGGSPAIRRKAR